MGPEAKGFPWSREDGQRTWISSGQGFIDRDGGCPSEEMNLGHLLAFGSGVMVDLCPSGFRVVEQL